MWSSAIELVDSGGNVVTGSRSQAVIGREASLDLSREPPTPPAPRGDQAPRLSRAGRPAGPAGAGERDGVPGRVLHGLFESLIAEGAGQGRRRSARLWSRATLDVHGVREGATAELSGGSVEKRRSPGEAQNRRSTSGSLDRSPCRTGRSGAARAAPPTRRWRTSDVAERGPRR